MRVRRGVFLVLWILSLIGIFFYGGVISYGMFWGLTLLPVVSAVYLILVMFQFRIYQEIESRTIVCKQPMPYYFILRNESFLAFSGLRLKLFKGLSYVTDIEDKEEYELLPGDEYVYHTQMVCKYRGEYEVGVQEVVITDFLRLFSIRYRLPSTIKALVYPRVIRKPELSTIPETITVSYLDTPWNQTEPDVLTRDYVTGDALKRIHWKASAKEQKLKTRTMLGERQQEILLLCDTTRYSEEPYIYLPIESQILETMLALGVFFVDKKIACRVYWGQQGLRDHRVESMQQFTQLYEETAQIVFDKRENVEAVLQQVTEGSYAMGAKALLVVLHRVSDEVLGRLQLLAERGLEIMVYLITDENVDTYVRQSNSRLKIVVIPVEGDLEELL